jgi:predicted MPP superfamily phosphohydrolase
LRYERYLIDLFLLTAVVAIQGAGAWMLWRRTASELRRRIIVYAALASFGVLVCGVLLRFRALNQFLPAWAPGWGRGAIILWAFTSVLLVAAFAIAGRIRVQPHHSPARRAFLQTAQAAVLGVPLAASGYGVFVQRFNFALREQKVVIPGLPEDLENLRLVQLSDIHLSPFLSVRELEHVIGMANETRAHAALITGDLITREGDPLDDCLERLRRLRTDAGIFGCLGNHETYAEAEEHATQQGAALGIQFLRRQARLLRFGQADLNLVGVDYQPTTRPYLKGVERLMVPGAVNVLLSHNPDVFPVAARKGFPLTVSGHTHGGQIRVEILRQDLNVARFFTPYTDGLYEESGASVFVTRGIGTIGLPARLGAPPEVALLRLCRT